MDREIWIKKNMDRDIQIDTYEKRNKNKDVYKWRKKHGQEKETRSTRNDISTMQTFDKCLDDDGGHELTSCQVISYLAKLLCRANILLYSGRGILSPYNVHLHNCIDLHIHTKAM